MNHPLYTNTDIWRAYNIALQAHNGQFRRDGKTEYITHPMAVESLLQNESVEIRIVALLHDVLEDTKVKENDLRSIFSSNIVDAIVALTHYDGETYDEYLSRVKSNKIACKVKICDMLHNLSCSPSKKQISRYLKGLEFLFS